MLPLVSAIRHESRHEMLGTQSLKEIENSDTVARSRVGHGLDDCVYDWTTTGALSLQGDTLETCEETVTRYKVCLLYTSPSPRDGLLSRMPSSA